MNKDNLRSIVASNILQASHHWKGLKSMPQTFYVTKNPKLDPIVNDNISDNLHHIGLKHILLTPLTRRELSRIVFTFPT